MCRCVFLSADNSVLISSLSYLLCIIVNQDWLSNVNYLKNAKNEISVSAEYCRVLIQLWSSDDYLENWTEYRMRSKCNMIVEERFDDLLISYRCTICYSILKLLSYCTYDILYDITIVLLSALRDKKQIISI